jgi:tetratricopeptide (TPR) repeat protein
MRCPNRHVGEHSGNGDQPPVANREGDLAFQNVEALLLPAVDVRRWPWFALRRRDWRSSLVETKRWQLDQPFSSRPAAFGSYIASVALGNYAEAAELAKQGLLANPDDFGLQNNAAFSLVLSGNSDEAAQIISRVNQAHLNPRDQVVIIATRGLIQFRSGDEAAGRALYRQAIELGKSLRDEREHIARIYYALEEIRAGYPSAEDLRREALDGAANLSEPIYARLVDRLRNAKIGSLL